MELELKSGQPSATAEISWFTWIIVPCGLGSRCTCCSLWWPLIGLVTFFAFPCILSAQGPNQPPELSLSPHSAQYGLVPVTYLPCSSSSHCLSSLASRSKVICPSLCPLGTQCVSIANQHCLKLLVNSYIFPEPYRYRTYLPQEGIHWVGSSIHSFMYQMFMLPGAIRITEYMTQVPALKVMTL